MLYKNQKQLHLYGMIMRDNIKLLQQGAIVMQSAHDR